MGDIMETKNVQKTSTVQSGTPQVKLIRINEVAALTTYSKQHIYTLARNGHFPKARKLGANTSVWLEHEVLAWISARLGLNLEVVA